MQRLAAYTSGCVHSRPITCLWVVPAHNNAQMSEAQHVVLHQWRQHNCMDDSNFQTTFCALTLCIEQGWYRCWAVYSIYLHMGIYMCLGSNDVVMLLLTLAWCHHVTVGMEDDKNTDCQCTKSHRQSVSVTEVTGSFTYTSTATGTDIARFSRKVVTLYIDPGWPVGPDSLQGSFTQRTTETR